MIMNDKDYRDYCEAMEDKSPELRHDPLDFDTVVSCLQKLVSHEVTSTDGGYRYKVTSRGVYFEEERLGKTTWQGLVGWVCSVDELTDLIDEIELDGDVERALWACGFGN